jgi:diacylglycerol kinase (ATP)
MTSPFGTLAVIADPHAGEGHVASRIEAVGHELEARGLPYRLQVANTPTAVTRLAAAALDEGYRFVVAVGDDQTVHHLVNGVFRDGRPILEDPVLGVIPADSGCDLTKSFGLPGDVQRAVAHLAGDETYPLDVMKIAVTDEGGGTMVRYAHNVAEVGLHAAAWRLRTSLPRPLGNARRFVGFWSAYATNRVRSLRLRTDTKEHDLRAWSVVVGNAQFADGGLRLSPRSFPGDGVLDVLVFTGPKSDAYRLLPRIFRHGDHVPDPQIKELRVKLTLRVESDRRMPVVADGGYLGTTPASFQVVPQQILLKL